MKEEQLKKVLSSHEINKVIGKRLYMLRTRKDYSQTQVAKYLNVNQTTYSRIERGIQSIEPTIIHKICLLYNVDPNYIFEYVSEHKTNKMENFNVEISEIIEELKGQVCQTVGSKMSSLEKLLNRIEKM